MNNSNYWYKIRHGRARQCSACKWKNNAKTEWAFCPNCKSKMKIIEKK